MLRVFDDLSMALGARQGSYGGARPDLSYRGNELAGETGEACNIIKKLERERLGMKGSRATVEQLREELADVVICVELIARMFNIDMRQAVVDKFNKTSDSIGSDVKMVVRL